jgi:uncharacterized protein YjiK
MKITFKIPKILSWAIILLSVLAALIYYFRLEALGWYAWHNYYHANTDVNGFHLRHYQVAIDGLPLEALENASGLTFNDKRNTLFTVLNKESKIIEFDLQGNLIREVSVVGAEDMEGITYVEGNRYVIADERDNRLVQIELEDDATVIDITSAPKINLGINVAGNKNFEGVSWDDVNNRLLVVKERDPKYIMSVTGFFNADLSKPLNIQIRKIEAFDQAIKWAMRDLSSVTFHSETGHLLLLSDESRLIKEYDEDGKALSALALWKGFHGLKAHVPQAEGIAVGSDKSIYIMSEPNLFYVFKPTQP